MHPRESIAPPALRHPVLGLFVAVELACLAGFVVSLLAGKTALAVAFVVSPLQVVVLLVMSADDFFPLLLLALLLPLAGLELLPDAYCSFILYPSVVGLLTVCRTTGRAADAGLDRGSLMSSERVSLLLLAGWVIASCANAVLRGWNSADLRFYTILALEVLAMAYFFAVVPCSLRQVTRLLYAAVAMLVVVVVVVFFLPGAFGQGGGLGGKAVLTPFGRASLNAFATFLCSLSAVVVGMMLDERKLAVRALLGAVVALLVAALLLTQSRGAWLGFGVAAVYLVSRARSFWLTAALAAGVLLLLSVESLRHALLTRVGATTASDPSLMGRFVLWLYAWKIAKANLLLGVGMENFRYVKHLFGYPLPIRYALQFNAHNIYLEFLVDLGVVGLGCLLWLIVGVALRLGALSRPRGSEGRGLAIGLTAGLIAYAVHGLLDALTWQHGAFMLLAVLLGLAMCVRRLSSSSPSVPRSGKAFSVAAGDSSRPVPSQTCA